MYVTIAAQSHVSLSWPPHRSPLPLPLGKARQLDDRRAKNPCGEEQREGGGGREHLSSRLRAGRRINRRERQRQQDSRKGGTKEREKERERGSNTATTVAPLLLFLFLFTPPHRPSTHHGRPIPPRPKLGDEHQLQLPLVRGDSTDLCQADHRSPALRQCQQPYPRRTLRSCSRSDEEGRHVSEGSQDVRSISLVSSFDVVVELARLVEKAA